jgi:hypothetical protein
MEDMIFLTSSSSELHDFTTQYTIFRVTAAVKAKLSV